MANIETTDDFMPITPEMEAIWNSDDELPVSNVKPVDEVEEEEESEQPEDTADTEDSDEDEEDDIVEDEEEVEEESNEDDPEATADELEDKSKETQTQSYKVKANGMEFDFTTEELLALAPKAMDYTKKMQEIAPWRKTISALKDNGLGEQEVNLMIDVLQGDKNAIAQVLKRTGVDALDIDTETDSGYAPKQYGKDESVQAIEDIINDISRDPEYRITEHVVDSQWDSASRRAMASNPQMIRGLHDDIKNGIYDKVAPMALKMKAMDGGRASDLEYYIEAGKRYYANIDAVQTQERDVQARQVKQTDIKEMAGKRKAATPTKRSIGKRDVIDYLDDNDESYEEWYKKTMAKA